MDGALVFLIIIGAIISSINKNAKQKKGQAAQRTRQLTAQRAAQQRAAQQAAPNVTVHAPVAPVTPVAPAAHHHEMQPTITVTPHTDDMFAGSMYAESTEGYDPCHEDELQPEVKPCEVSPAAIPQSTPAPGGVQLKWTGDEMVRAFVMSEVLKRPQDRRR